MRDDSPIRVEKRKYLLALSFLIFVFIAVLGASSTDTVRPGAASDGAPESDATAVLCSLEDSFGSIAKQAEPCVVSITAVQSAVHGETKGSRSTSDGLEEDLSEGFPGRNQDRRFQDLQLPRLPPGHPDIPVTATGSGTIIRRQGENFYVLTNYHLVKNAYGVNVRLADATPLKGIVVGVDPATDLAVVRISSPKLSDRNVIRLGDSNSVKVGSWALAVGNPYGFEHSLTVGVVSALHRELEDDGEVYFDLIQTDAAINKGNSGGPLLDVEGRIVGVNSAIASPTEGFVGLGFAVPINTAKAILDNLIRDGRVIRGWLGIGIQELTPVLQDYYGVQRGVLVASVQKDGPSAKAGIRSEDVIVTVSDTSVSEVRQLQRLITGSRPGTTLPVSFVRGARRQTVQVRVGLLPSTPSGRPSPPPAVVGDPGVRVRTLTGELAKALGIPQTKGAIVVEVRPASPAAEAGLEGGDVVVNFNGRPVASENDFNSLLKALRSGEIAALKVMTGEASRIIGFRLE